MTKDCTVLAPEESNDPFEIGLFRMIGCLFTYCIALLLLIPNLNLVRNFMAEQAPSMSLWMFLIGMLSMDISLAGIGTAALFGSRKLWLTCLSTLAASIGLLAPALLGW